MLRLPAALTEDFILGSRSGPCVGCLRRNRVPSPPGAPSHRVASSPEDLFLPPPRVSPQVREEGQTLAGPGEGLRPGVRWPWGPQDSPLAPKGSRITQRHPDAPCAGKRPRRRCLAVCADMCQCGLWWEGGRNPDSAASAFILARPPPWAPGLHALARTPRAGTGLAGWRPSTRAFPGVLLDLKQPPPGEGVVKPPFTPASHAAAPPCVSCSLRPQ